MTVVLLLAVVILALALVAAVVVAHKRGRARRQLESRHAEVESELATTRDELARAASDRDATAEALDETRRQHEVTLEEAEAARARADAAAAELAATESDLAGARRELAIGRASELDAAALWQLELTRAEREWRADGAPTPDWPSPLDGSDDPLAAAVRMRSESLRETAGFVVELEWTAAPPPTPAAALGWFRVLDELLTHASRHLDWATVVAADADGAMTVTLAGGELPDSESLASAVLAAGGELSRARQAGAADTEPAGEEPALLIRLVRPPGTPDAPAHLSPDSSPQDLE